MYVTKIEQFNDHHDGDVMAITIYLVVNKMQYQNEVQKSRDIGVVTYSQIHSYHDGCQSRRQLSQRRREHIDDLS